MNRALGRLFITADIASLFLVASSMNDLFSSNRSNVSDVAQVSMENWSDVCVSMENASKNTLKKEAWRPDLQKTCNYTKNCPTFLWLHL